MLSRCKILIQINLIVLLSIGCNGLNGQEVLQEGFELLEQGQWQKAEFFFQDYLKEDPTNKTARLCLGRAVGLNGNPDEANLIFTELLYDYPQDFEILLNRAESEMWRQNFESALIEYKQLLNRESNNPVALLGRSNAFAALKKKRQAYLSINQARELTNEDPILSVSHKYIHLAYADSLQKAGDLDISLKIFKALDARFNDDVDVVKNLATASLIRNDAASASVYYHRVLKLDSLDVQALLGASYSDLLLNRSKENLLYARKAYANINNYDAAYENQIKINLIDALAFNKMWDEHGELLSEFLQNQPNDFNLRLAQSRSYVWQGHFEKGIKGYTELLDDYPEETNLYLSIADAYMASGLSKEAKNFTHRARQVDSLNFDAIKMELKINRERNLKIYGDFSRSEDSGDITKQIASLEVHSAKINNTHFFAKLKSLTTDELIGLSSQKYNGALGLSSNIGFKHKLVGEIGLMRAEVDQIKNPFNRFTYGASLNSRWSPRINTEIFTKKSFHDYTFSLVFSEISMQDYGLNINYNTEGGLGIYGQYLLTDQNDNNTRQLYYVSLYYLFKKQPTLKFGANVHYFKFDFDSENLYFSPDSYQNIESFIQFENLNITRHRWRYNIFASVGRQQIDAQSSQFTRRLELELGYVGKNERGLFFYFRSSNAAQSTVSGFSFNQFGLRFKG